MSGTVSGAAGGAVLRWREMPATAHACGERAFAMQSEHDQGMIRKTMSTIRAFPAAIYKEWKKDEVMRHAAAIAYYTVFSLPAMLLVVFSIASFLLGESVVTGELFGRMRFYIGDRPTELLQGIVRNVNQDAEQTWWAAIIGSVILLIIGSGVIKELRVSLNRIFNISHAKAKFSQTILNRIASVLLLILAAFVLIASIISGLIVSLLNQRVEEFIAIPLNTLSLVNNSVTYITVTILFFLLYLFLPAKKYPPLIILLSSVIASALLVSGTVLASYYITRANVGEAYGVAANVLVLLFWIYFAANIFLIGAEIIDVTSRLEGFTPQKRTWPRRIFRRKR